MKVEFPEFIDRARLFFIFEMDFLAVFFGSLLMNFWLLGKVMMSIFAIIVAIVASSYILQLYIKAKYEKAPGFIRHYFYNLGIFKIKMNEEKYPELKFRDSKNFYPSGFIRDFRD